MELFSKIKDAYLRKKYFVERGANITEHLMNPKDVFVYEKEDVTGKIIKKTDNEPGIGSVIQLDYNPKIVIFKHIYDKKLDLHFWYCKYMPNNGRDAIPTY